MEHHRIVIGVIGGVIAIVLLLHSVVRRIGEVGDNADRLGFFEPLLPVTPAEDEIGRLAEQLQAASTLLTRRRVTSSRGSRRSRWGRGGGRSTAGQGQPRTETLTAVMGFGQLMKGSNFNEEDTSGRQDSEWGRSLQRIIEEGRFPGGHSAVDQYRNSARWPSAPRARGAVPAGAR